MLQGFWDYDRLKTRLVAMRNSKVETNRVRYTYLRIEAVEFYTWQI
jgi:hypothetical protein